MADTLVERLTGQATANAVSAEIGLVMTDAALFAEDCDPRRRRFDGVLARLLVYRDQHCRDPFCDAPIRHLDHIQAFAAGGPTTIENGRGVCQRGNYARQMPGFSVRLIDPTRHVVEITTPTGHRYRSPAPTAPGADRRPALRRRT